MGTTTKISESSIARMAGNIAGELLDACVVDKDATPEYTDRVIIAAAAVSVRIARAIAAEVERTSPASAPEGRV